MALTIDQITDLFDQQGAVQYGSEAVTQQQHAQQCAHLAEQAGAGPELVAAALLHDLGHLLAPGGSATVRPLDDVHQYVAVPFLRGLFPDAVIEPVRMHVDAKRYLCRADTLYEAGLSPASRRSLALQGGPFSEEQAVRFLAQPFATDAIALRRWDDLAKDVDAMPPGWAHYKQVLEAVSCAANAAARTEPA